MFGSSLNMTPMAILGGLVIWGGFWGLPGAVLSVPLLAVQKIALSHANHPMATYSLMVSAGFNAPVLSVNQPFLSCSLVIAVPNHGVNRCCARIPPSMSSPVCGRLRRKTICCMAQTKLKSRRDSWFSICPHGNLRPGKWHRQHTYCIALIRMT